MKLCSKCKIEKLIEFFSSTGSWCKQCKAKLESNRRLAQGIKPKLKPIVTETQKQCLKCFQLLGFSNFSPNKRGYLGLQSYCRLCFQKHCKVTKEKAREYTKKYRKDNPYAASLHRIHQFERRNKIKVTSDGTVTKEFLLELFKCDICAYCKKFCESQDKTIDHIIPLAKQGKHISSNITMCCSSCNSSKQDKLLEEWNDRC